jgi:hypothetical protein
MGIGSEVSARDDEVALVGATGAALGDEGSESVGGGGGAHLGGAAQGLEGERGGGITEDGFDAVESGRSRVGGDGVERRRVELEGEAVAGGEELEGEALGATVPATVTHSAERRG